MIEALDRDPDHPDLAVVREETVRATRRFVRRQRSWFRRDRPHPLARRRRPGPGGLGACGARS
ncbi:hypothetical protein [Pseudonocardia sp. ICBG601]|uniref:hypothetical protein n=1 Tax=Pseudonocardia sp. ICBG601 TaxID=2846759 RepID=UPI0027E2D545|nr:hypothetical protein [Pseudonocardia sp. ICBG601]